jgi:hypothetical protein
MIKYLIVTELFVVILTFLVVSCNQLIPTEMKLDVDYNLLGVREKDARLGVSYEVPQAFTKLSAADVPEHYKQLLSQRADGLTGNSMYTDTLTGLLMSLSEIDKGKWEEYENLLEQAPASPLAMEWNFVNATEFRYNTFQVQQWLLQDYEWINFRFLFRKGTSFFQVDYFIPTPHFNQETDRLITSCVGSFNAQN